MLKTPDEASTDHLPRRSSTVTTIPPPEPRHGIAELLRLVGAVRWLAFDRNLPPDDALRRIRDAFADYDEGACQ